MECSSREGAAERPSRKEGRGMGSTAQTVADEMFSTSPPPDFYIQG